MSFDIHHAWYKFVKNTMLAMPRRGISIDSIFGKVEDKRKNPNFYEYILRYSTVMINDQNAFTHWDLARWLYDNYPEFKERYKDFSTRNTTISKRIEYTQESTKNSLHDLITLNLIGTIGERKIAKGTGYTPLYAFTWYGKLHAWIIESFDLAKQEKAGKEIYNLFAHHATHFHTSQYALGSALYKKFIDRGVFDDFVVDVLRRRINSDNPILDIYELLGCLAIPVITNREKARYFTQLWQETFNEMDPETQQFLLHSLKLRIEAKMEREAKFPQGFEYVRFKFRDRYDMVTVEGHCKNCDEDMNVGIRIKYYIERTQAPSEDPILGNCPTCKTESSVIYPKLEY